MRKMCAARKRVAVLGSTGSIGVSALDVLWRLKDQFEVVALAAGNNAELMAEQIKRFRPKYAALSKKGLSSLKLTGASKRSVTLMEAEGGLAEIAAAKDVDIVVLGVTGSSALDPFLAAVKAGKTVAPANKEALVMAGELIMKTAKKTGAKVIPVDSEQSAIFQCLHAKGPNEPFCVHLTASGGSLLNVPISRHDRLSVTDILHHPRWRMGKKITVDSATLMNKGFEVIEAMRLFGLSADQVKVVVHPESIVHSFVEFVDGSFLAQLGITDMRLPIQYALTYPIRLKADLPPLDPTMLGALTFFKPDMNKFPSLALAYHAAKESGTVPAVLNAADEIAVNAFLNRKIKFTDIYRVVEKTVRAHRRIVLPSLKEIRSADIGARSYALDVLNRGL